MGMRHPIRWLWSLSLCFAGGIYAADLIPYNEPLPIRNGDSRLVKPVRSWKALQGDRVVMQRLDYSCGAAALSTLFRYYFEDGIDEELVLSGILNSLSAEEVADRENNGFSLLDLKNFALSLGYQAAGVKLKYASLPKLKGPILIHLATDEYRHFAVLKGVRGDRVYLADPSRGNIRMSMERFSREWTGVALILGKRGFGVPTSHPLALSDQEPVQDELLAAYRALVMH